MRDVAEGVGAEVEVRREGGVGGAGSVGGGDEGVERWEEFEGPALVKGGGDVLADQGVEDGSEVGDVGFVVDGIGRAEGEAGFKEVVPEGGDVVVVVEL